MFKKIATYSAGLYAITILASVIRVILRSLIAKNLGQEAFGAYSYFTSAQDVGVSLLSFGLVRSLAKYVAASSKDDINYSPIVNSIFFIIIVISIFLTGIALAISNFVEWIWVYILISIGPYALFSIARATMRGQFERNRELLLAFVNVVVQGAGVAVFVIFFPSTQSPVIGLAMGNILVAAGIFFYFFTRDRMSWYFVSIQNSFKSDSFRSLMVLSSPLWLTEILAVIGDQADTLIVQGQLGYAVLAEYGAAFTFIGLLSKPTSVLSRIFLVTFASGHYTDFEKYKQVTSLNSAFISTLGLAATVVAIPLTPIIFTDEYVLAPLLTAILSVSFVFKSIEVLNTAFTIAVDYPQANLYSKLWTLAVYLPAAFILVSNFGVIGAAISNVISWSVYALIHAIYMKKKLPQHAAFTIRHSLIGSFLYTSIVSVVFLVSKLWIVILAVPLYLGVGHMLKLWNLKQAPNLIVKLLPKRVLSKYPFIQNFAEKFNA